MNARLIIGVGLFFVSGFCFGKAHSAHQIAKEMEDVIDDLKKTRGNLNDLYTNLSTKVKQNG